MDLEILLYYEGEVLCLSVAGGRTEFKGFTSQKALEGD
jgi:hypothetical protein